MRINQLNNALAVVNNPDGVVGGKKPPYLQIGRSSTPYPPIQVRQARKKLPLI